MTEISATDASRRFADVLDAVEHRGESFTIRRRGHVVARLEPVTRVRGSDVKAVLRHHRVDQDWRGDLDAVRDLLVLEER